VCKWIFVLVPLSAYAQMHMDMDMKMNSADMSLMNEASGTGLNPTSWPMPMFMPRLGSWSLMLMGQAFVVDTQQSGPRGGDKFYSTNWFMTAAQHSVGRGSFRADLMLSLEPATITGRQYPELFQTGETAFGKPIVDGQHPHNLIMGLGFHYLRPLTEGTTIEAYFAPVGDPALGPVAYPHRASALELPQATLSHHWQDSTHIANDVVTVAVRRSWLRVEASGFHGAEPWENRWVIEQGAIDSWSGRVSVFPSKNWMAQVSAGRLTRPERESPGDVVRATASLHYTRPMGRDAWSSSFIWGRDHNTFTHHDLDSFTAETLLPLPGRNYLTGRAEWVDKDELFGADGVAVRVAAYTAGVTHDLAQTGPIETGIGANVTAYSVPTAIQPFYGSRPYGVDVFLRFRLRPNR